MSTVLAISMYDFLTLVTESDVLLFGLACGPLLSPRRRWRVICGDKIGQLATGCARETLVLGDSHAFQHHHCFGGVCGVGGLRKPILPQRELRDAALSIRHARRG